MSYRVSDAVARVLGDNVSNVDDALVIAEHVLDTSVYRAMHMDMLKTLTPGEYEEAMRHAFTKYRSVAYVVDKVSKHVPEVRVLYDTSRSVEDRTAAGKKLTGVDYAARFAELKVKYETLMRAHEELKAKSKSLNLKRRDQAAPGDQGTSKKHAAMDSVASETQVKAKDPVAKHAATDSVASEKQVKTQKAKTSVAKGVSLQRQRTLHPGDK